MAGTVAPTQGLDAAAVHGSEVRTPTSVRTRVNV
jgi:hypothetical protein